MGVPRVVPGSFLAANARQFTLPGSAVQQISDLIRLPPPATRRACWLLRGAAREEAAWKRRSGGVQGFARGAL